MIRRADQTNDIPEEMRMKRILVFTNEISSEASFKENLCWPGEGWPKVSKEKDAERREARRDVQRLMSKGTAAHGQHSTGQADGHGSCLMSLSRTSLQGVLGAPCACASWNTYSRFGNPMMRSGRCYHGRSRLPTISSSIFSLGNRLLVSHGRSSLSFQD